MLTYRRIDLELDEELIVDHRLDSFKESFGHTNGFGNVKHYLSWVEEKSAQFPDGFVIVMYEGKVIGQLELQVQYDECRRIGYVNLYYLIPEYRDKGFGLYLKEYAEEFFRKHRCPEYQLRVSPTNKRAIHFYEKCGMVLLKEEMFDDPVLRMYKKL